MSNETRSLTQKFSSLQKFERVKHSFHLDAFRPQKAQTVDSENFTWVIFLVGMNRHSNRHTPRRKCKLRSKF